MLYLTYSRFWYKDKGFEDEADDDEDDDDDKDEDDEDDDDDDVEVRERRDDLYKQLTRTARFAIPDDLRPEDTDGSQLSDEESNLEGLKKFRGLPVGDVYF